MLSKEEFLKRYPNSNYEIYADSEKKAKEYYSLPTETLNAHFQAIFVENKERGFSND